MLAVALLMGGPARARETLAPATDLQADGQLARREGKPLVLFFSMEGCDYCEVVRRNYLAPLLREASPARRPLIREADLTGAQAITGFDGAATTPKALAARYRVRVAPTVLFLDSQGKLLAEPLVGGDTAGMYGAYLDNAFAEAARKLK